MTSNAVLELEPGDGEVAPGIVELAEEHLRGVYEVAAECIPEMAIPQQAAVPAFEEWLVKEERLSAAAFVALDGDLVAGNDAMRAANERLGYRPLPASIVVEGLLP